MRLPIVFGVAAAALLAATPAAGQNFSGYYRLQSMYLESEDRCLEGNRPGPGQAVGGAAFMDRCQNVSGQLWKLTREANGYYRLTTMFVEPEGLCFESNKPGHNMSMGGAAFMDRCQNVSGQLWRLTREANGYYRLTSMFVEPEDRCLESNRPGGNAAMGGAAFMDRCQNVSGQLWRLVPASGGGRTSASPPASPPVRQGSPSFDCRRAGNAAEHAICGSAFVASLDVRLDAVYASLLARLHGRARSQLEREQRSWLQGRNACGAALGCLTAAYQDRISELER